MSSRKLFTGLTCAVVLAMVAAGVAALQVSSGPALPIARPPAGFSTVSDDQGFTRGPFTAFMAPFNRGALVAGRDYTESFSFNPASFPAASQLSWNWPAAGPRAPIRGFLAVDYGNYYNTIPAAPVQAARLGDVRKLMCEYDLSVTGDLAGFDTIVDFFLTAAPGFGKIKFEVEIFLHAPAYARNYADSVTPIGDATASDGRIWKVSIDPHGTQAPDILLYPRDGADALAGTIDIRQILSWLIERGTLSGNEFVNGLAIGIEPQQKTGSATIHNFSVSYSPFNAGAL